MEEIDIAFFESKIKECVDEVDVEKLHQCLVQLYNWDFIKQPTFEKLAKRLASVQYYNLLEMVK